MVANATKGNQLRKIMVRSRRELELRESLNHLHFIVVLGVHDQNGVGP